VPAVGYKCRCKCRVNKSNSSSSCSVLLQERCRFHDFTPQFTIICYVPGRPQTQVLLFQVVFYCTQPRLSRTTARSSPVLRQVVDASACGPHLNLNDVAEESQTPGHDRLGDRRLNGAGANYLVGDVGGEGNLQNVMCRRHH